MCSSSSMVKTSFPSFRCLTSRSAFSNRSWCETTDSELPMTCAISYVHSSCCARAMTIFNRVGSLRTLKVSAMSVTSPSSASVARAEAISRRWECRRSVIMIEQLFNHRYEKKTADARPVKHKSRSTFRGPAFRFHFFFVNFVCTLSLFARNSLRSQRSSTYACPSFAAFFSAVVSTSFIDPVLYPLRSSAT